MSTPLWLMIPMALMLGAGFLGAFLYNLRSGQFDDVETPAHRILQEDLNPERIFDEHSNQADHPLR